MNIKKIFLLLAWLLVGCSIDVTQLPSTPFPNTPQVDSTPSPHTTLVPVLWTGLNLSGRLVYISQDLSGENLPPSIYILDLISGEVTTLFTAPDDAWIFYASVSPDTKFLVMSYIASIQSGANRMLYILPLVKDSSPQVLLTPPTPDDHYTQAEWSPDGNYIYYVHYNDSDRPTDEPYPAYDLSRMAYPSGIIEKVVEQAFWPRLSPELTKLVYVHLDPASGLNELHLANADGSDSRKLDLSDEWTQGIIDAPLFSPDGQSIFFSVPSLAQANQPKWWESLLGIQVAHAHNIPSDWWSVPVAGGTPTQLTNIQTINLFGSISPDQKHIASVSGDGLFVMDLDGSNLTQILSDPGIYGTVSWLPASP